MSCLMDIIQPKLFELVDNTLLFVFSEQYLGTNIVIYILI